MTDEARPRQVRLVVVDDHTLFRQGLLELLASDPGVHVVADGASGPEAVSLATVHQPDVLLLDVEMPGPGAAATIAELRRNAPRTQVAVLTMHHDADLVRDLLDSGAVAYLAKTIVREQLLSAVWSVAVPGGNVVLSVPRAALGGLEPSIGKVSLSARELEVFRLVARACSNAQVAAELFITEATVKRHLTNVYAKLGAVSRVDAIRKGRAARLIRDEGS